MILAINTALKKESVALISSPSEALVSETSWISHADESKKVIPALKRILGHRSIPFEKIKSILIVQGPGSFTGTRIGVVIANTLAYVLRIPITALTVPELWRKRCAGKSGVILLNQGQGKVYAEGVGWKFHIEKQTLEFILSKLSRKQPLTFFGELNPEQERIFRQKKSLQWKFLGDKGLKTFGEVASEWRATGGNVVSPIYWHAPHITPRIHA